MNPGFVSPVEALIRELERLSIHVAYLFGSQARLAADARSDVDVGILPNDTVREEDRLRLQATVSAIASDHFRVDRADVVLVDEAPPDIAMAAIRGKVLFGRNENHRIVVESQVMSRYHDRAYHRARWYREVPPRWARGEFA